MQLFCTIATFSRDCNFFALLQLFCDYFLHVILIPTYFYDVQMLDDTLYDLFDASRQFFTTWSYLAQAAGYATRVERSVHSG